MPSIRFHCATCGLDLTPPLQLLDDPALLIDEEEEDYLPDGFFTIADGEQYPATAGDYLINLKDAINTMPHPNPSRLNGCCGLDGLSGKNVVCLHGHEVGTERSDCWLAHSLALDPAAVVGVPAIDY